MPTTKPPAALLAAGGFVNIVKRHPNIEGTKNWLETALCNCRKESSIEAQITCLFSKTGIKISFRKERWFKLL